MYFWICLQYICIYKNSSLSHKKTDKIWLSLNTGYLSRKSMSNPVAHPVNIAYHIYIYIYISIKHLLEIDQVAVFSSLYCVSEIYPKNDLPAVSIITEKRLKTNRSIHNEEIIGKKRQKYRVSPIGMFAIIMSLFVRLIGVKKVSCTFNIYFSETK